MTISNDADAHWENRMPEFPYGRAPLGILVLMVLSGAGLALSSDTRQDRKRPDIIFATFTKEHAAAYRAALPAFERDHHCTVEIEVVDARALQSRLQAAMQIGAPVPDMVELQDGFMSFFTRGRLEDVQMTNLTDRLTSTGMHDQLVVNRFSKWTSRGRIFALPHDVHPTMLAYRRDLAEQLGVDVSRLTTWDEFTRVGREMVSRSMDQSGNPTHYMLDLPTDGSDFVTLLAMQRGGGMFDAAGNVTFDSEEYVKVICWYVQQIQGPSRISFPAGSGQNMAKAVLDGLVLFFICPDWRTNQFDLDIPSLSGKMGLIPLPAWEPGGRRTSTWGATGLAFPKQGKNFQLAWELAMYLYYNRPQLGARFLHTNILPPLKAAWTDPEFRQMDPYWDVSLGEKFVPLASQVPASPTNAYHYVAVNELSKAFIRASQHYAAHGETGLAEFTRQELRSSAEQVRQVIRRNSAITDSPPQGGG